MENSSSSLLFLQRTLITPLLISADKSLISLSQKSKILELLRQIFVSVFFFVLNVINTLPIPLLPFRFDAGTRQINKFDAYHAVSHKQLIHGQHDSNGRVIVSDTAIARAMDQLLMLVNDVPVSSRKYEVVRCLAEKLIDDNLKERCEVLREVNCVVLSEAFGRVLNGLELELLGPRNDVGVGFGLGRVMGLVTGWGGVKETCGGAGQVNSVFAEKTVAELLWLAQKLVASGGGEVAVEKWAWASNLGWLALSCEPRVQASLVKLTAFLIKQAKQIAKQHQTQAQEWEQQKQTLMQMLMTWVPLLCQASNGTDTPTLTLSERADVEKALEDIIDMLNDVDSKEKVLSVWLRHFTLSPFSDWPNLYGSYVKWLTMSRKLLVTR
ncbi:hypothetical protein RND81_09G158400 [Saponaria officinalis]|uniref:Uncharacterized protein n=1 Tax=Saponaria officinalis TaxID=3572 RepID=A0AAW1IM15_SAPOF